MMNEPNIASESGELMRGDAARYGAGVGQWPAPAQGGQAARMGVLLAAVAEAARTTRAAQRRAVRCGLGGSTLEQALEANAQAAEGVEKRMRPEVYY